MPLSPRRRFPVLLPGVALLALGATFLHAGELSPLAAPPDWSTLEGYQRTIHRDEFQRLIDQVYSPDGAFWKYAVLDDRQVTLYADLAHAEKLFTLRFAASGEPEAARPYAYRTRAPDPAAAQPLKGLRIALDPGHIGGRWALLEERHFQLGGDPPVEEATLAMITCDLLAAHLKADGAEVVWAKHGYDPVTPLRPDDLHREAIASLAQRPDTGKRKRDEPGIERMIDRQAALLFYRVAEIRARAAVVNKLRPDLTVCVHWNADDWGDPAHPTLTKQSRLVIFTNGSYEKSELVNDDVKFDLMRKLLDRTAAQEERGCALVGRAMLDALGYPPETYAAYFARHVTDVPSVFARNLLANRLYHGPVIYCEGPYMNAKDAYPRIIAGDYEGVRTIAGQAVPSIYRQYADSVWHGVRAYFGVN